MKIYTKTGDKGSTSLFSGERVQKNSLRVDSYGTVDELNSIIGLALAHKPKEPILSDLTHISNLLFILGSDMATSPGSKNEEYIQRISTKNIEWLETCIDSYDKELPPLKDFILPGGTVAASHIHHGRTVCRRAERLAVALAESEKVNYDAIIFLNRLSDYLFMAARYSNFLDGKADIVRDKSL